MYRAVSITLVTLLALLLSGCYDYSEPDEKAWVLALGMDKGRQNVLTVTAVIAIPKNIAGGGGNEPASGGGGEGFYTVSMETPTLLSSLELIDAMVDRRIDLSHIKWLVFSRELAEDGIGQYYAPLARFYQFRRTSHMIICEERAEDLLAKGVPKLEDNVGKYYELLYRGWKHTEFIPFDTFHEFYIKANSPGVTPVSILVALNRREPVYPDDSPKPKGDYQAGRIPRKGGDQIEMMGGAIIKQGKMIGTLNGKEVGIQKLFFNTLKITINDIPDPANPSRYIIVEVKPRQKPDIDVQIVDGYPKINVDAKLEGEIYSIQSGKNYENPQKLPVVEEVVERSIKEDIEKTIAKSQELGADFLGFGLNAKKLFLTWPEWEAYNWDEKFPEADITVNVDYKVRRIGLIRETVPLE